MRFLIFINLLIFTVAGDVQKPVLKNFGIPDTEQYTILNRIDKKIGSVIVNVEMNIKERNGVKYYHVMIKEGDAFLNEVEMNYDDLTTISEKRTDLKNNTLVEHYIYQGNNKVYFYNKEKNINKIFKVSDANIYSRYGYVISFRGFPFSVGNTVYFKTFMNEYGDALPMKLSCIAIQNVKVKAGSFNCYKLELTVSGWQSILDKDKYYLYFAKDPPHLFIKYEEYPSDGSFDKELISIGNLSKI